MIRRLVKSAAAAALSFTGVDARIGRGLGDGDAPRIIAYHRVVRDLESTLAGSLPAMLISDRMLARHLEWLARRFDLVALDDLGSILGRGTGRGRGKPPAAVTFDDGYADFYDHAFPLLKRMGIPSAIFVVTDLVGTARMQVHDRLFLVLRRLMAEPRFRRGHLERFLIDAGLEPSKIAGIRRGLSEPVSATPAILESLPADGVDRVIAAAGGDPEMDRRSRAPYESLTWGMVIEMSRAGVTIGSHSRSHLIMTNADIQSARLESVGSRLALESRLGMDVRHFAYPAGRFDPEAVRAVAEGGYRFAYTTCRHRDRSQPLLTIPRTVFWERTCLDAFDRFSPAMMSCQVHRVFDLGRVCPHDRTVPRRGTASATASRVGAVS
jgi:peptidoglycan/xylan/chitin deacetylase (PgdA/CDA1 family)